MELLGMGHRIIEGASALFFGFGYSKVTVDEIAERVGCTKKTIYNHFPTKLDLLNEVIKSSVHGLIYDLEKIAENDGFDFLEKLTRMLEYIFIQFTTHKRNLLEEFGKYADDSNENLLPAVRDKLIPIIQGLVDEGVTKGLVKPSVSKTLLPYTYLSLVWGEIVLYRRFSLEINPGELLVESIKYTLGGILTPKGVRTLLEEGKSFEKK